MMYGASNSTSTSTITAREEGGGDTQAGIGERENISTSSFNGKNPKLEKLVTIINIINVHYLS